MLLFSPASRADEALTDTNIEAQLDQYLIIWESDAKKAGEFLETLSASVNDKTPSVSHARYLAYRASSAVEAKQLEVAEGFVQELETLAAKANNADVSTEAIAARMELLSYHSETTKAAVLREDLVGHAKNATQARIRYYGFNTAARSYYFSSQYEKALPLFQAAYDAIADDPNPRTPIRKMFIKSNIASLHASLQNWDLSLKTVNECIAEATQKELLFTFLPSLFIQKGFVLVELNRLPEAIEANDNGLVWARKLNKRSAEMTLINNQGDIYMRQNVLDKARQNFEQFLDFSLKEEDKSSEALARFNLGYIQVKQGLHRQGTEAMERAIAYYEKEGEKSSYIAYLSELADAYGIAKWHDKESITLRKYLAVSKELFQAEREKQLNQLQEQFSAKEKAKQIELLTKDNAVKEGEIQNKALQQKIAILIGVVILLASTLLWQLYKKVRKANLKLKEVNDQLAYQSLRDPLTGLFNRRSFHERMKEREARGERRATHNQFADGFILLDVDHFKRINDGYGHAAGDVVLVEIGRRLTEMSRSDDMVLRWGGEEFLILMRRVDIETLTKLTERVLYAIGSKPIEFEGKSIKVTASAGFLTLPFSDIDENVLNWEKALQLADMALYLGKVHGRNRAYGLQHLKIPYEQIKHTLETDLSKAIDADYLAVAQVLGPPQES